MIYVSENKAQIVKGDFHPARFYKGNKKIAGYTRETFEKEGSFALEECYNDRIYNAKLSGNSVLGGEPSPEAPVEIKSVGDLVSEGEHSGKYKIGVVAKNAVNLFDKDNMDFRKAYINVSHKQYMGSSDSSSVLIKCKPNTTYTISHTLDKLGVFRACCINTEVPTTENFYINAYEITQANTSAEKSLTVITGDACTYIVVQASSTNFNEFAETLLVTVGNSDAEEREETFDIYLDTPLCKIGSYEDYIDFENKKVVRNTSIKILTGSETWYREDFRLYAKINSKTGVSSDEKLCFCNRFKTYTWVSLYNNSSKGEGRFSIGCAIQPGSHLNITPAQTVPAVADWKAQLSAWNDEGNPLTVVCVDSAREETLDIPELPTFRGTTIYEINTDISAKISGEYKKQE